MLLLSIVSISTTILNPVLIENAPVSYCYSSSNMQGLGDFLKGIFNKKDKKADIKNEKTYVYLGGFPLGFTIMCKGVVVIAISNETAYEIKEGDIITKIEDEEITSVSQLLGIINSEKYKGRVVEIEYIRAGKINKTKIMPIYDEIQKIYKLGLWVRDNAAGVGTITYIRKDNYRFGALGHPVCDIDTGSLFPAKNGNIFKCNIVGYKKGQRGKAGELKGLFLRGASMLGTLDKNNEYGVYGKIDEKFIQGYDK